MNIEALTYEIAYEACFDAEIDGYGFDIAVAADIQHFLPRAREKAQRYADILSSVTV